LRFVGHSANVWFDVDPSNAQHLAKLDIGSAHTSLYRVCGERLSVP
jgi:hypothetical protein